MDSQILNTLQDIRDQLGAIRDILERFTELAESPEQSEYGPDITSWPEVHTYTISSSEETDHT